METREDEIISSHEYKKLLATMPQLPHYDLGIPSIDRLTGGFEPGELVIVTGYSGHGKTSLTQTLTVNLEQTNVPTLWFSYEVTPMQFFAKFNTLPQFYVPKKLTSARLPWIKQKIEEAVDKFGIKVVFIDHLHYLIDMMPSVGGNNSLVIGDLCRTLKRMAIDKGIVIVLIAHTGQPSDDKMPGMGSIRDSSFVVQEADAVYAIHRVKERKMGADIYTTNSKFLILKQRRTGTMGKQVNLEYRDNIFHEALKQD